MPRDFGSTPSLVDSGRHSIVGTPNQRLAPTEPMLLSYPGFLEQQPSDKGIVVRFFKTVKQGCATHGPLAKSGPGAEILWPTERARFSSKHYGFLKVLPGPDKGYCRPKAEQIFCQI